MVLPDRDTITAASTRILLLSSLVASVLLQTWPLRRRDDFAHLAWVWFAFASVQEGMAPLCPTPSGVGAPGCRRSSWT